MEDMTAGLWYVLGGILGVAFAGFLTVIFLGYIGEKGNKALNKGEMRRAMTAFFVLLFGFLVVASYFPLGLDLPKEIQGLFAGTVTIIIGFYFGSRPKQPDPTPDDNSSDGGESPLTGTPSDSSTRPPGAEPALAQRRHRTLH